ncbi:hypothetical protein [Nocardioides sp. P5_C9_2]
MSGIAVRSTRLESVALLGSLPDEVQAIMRPLVQPLLEQWDSVVGDHQAVREAAERWRGTGRHLHDLARRQHGTVDDTEGRWIGLAQCSWTESGRDVGVDLEALAERCTLIGACLDEASVAVHETERLVRDLVRELLEWAALTLAVSAVTGLVTLGASTVAGAATAAARAAVTGARITALVRRLAAVLHGIRLRVDAYRDWVQGLSFVRRQVVERAEKQVVGVVVKKPLRGATSEATGMDGQVREPLGALASARSRTRPWPSP